MSNILQSPRVAKETEKNKYVETGERRLAMENNQWAD